MHPHAKDVPGGPVPTAAHHGLTAHIIIGIAVVHSHVVADIDANVTVESISVIVGHGQHQAVNTGDAVQLVNVPGEDTIVLYLGAGPSIDAGDVAQIFKIGINQSSAVGNPHAVHGFSLSAVLIQPAVGMGHDAVLTQSQRGGSTRCFGRQSQAGKGSHQYRQGQQKAQGFAGRLRT